MTTDGRTLIELTELVIGASHLVANALGPGFNEKVYENALVHELRKRGLKIAQQAALQAHYDGIVVDQFFANLSIEVRLIVEPKAAEKMSDIFKAQCLSYLKAWSCRLGLVIVFGSDKVHVARLAN